VWHPVGLAKPDHTVAQGQPSTKPVRTPCGLPLSCRVVALEEVDGMPTPLPTPPAAASRCPAIPEACLPGEGTVVQINEIFRERHAV
jgi:hypothetical protein